MREIKFRGKQIDGHWIIGEGVTDNLFSREGTGETYLFCGPNYKGPGWCHVVNETIGQYTGLKDRNGIDIYEGDVVKWGDLDGYSYEPSVRIAIVEMLPALQFRRINSVDYHVFEYGNFSYKDTHKYLAVIGNIHDNKSMVEGMKQCK